MCAATAWLFGSREENVQNGLFDGSLTVSGNFRKLRRNSSENASTFDFVKLLLSIRIWYSYFFTVSILRVNCVLLHNGTL